MTALVSAPFAAVLRSGRAHFNALFATARRRYPELDAEAFKHFLATAVDPLIINVHAVSPDAASSVAQAAYELGLELVGQRLAGTAARYPVMAAGLPRLLPLCAPFLNEQPYALLAALCNALHNLAVTPGARVEQWLSDLERLLPKLPDRTTLLSVGQVCAWRAGLAHFREPALQLASQMPATLAKAVFQLDPAADWPLTLQRLLRDPWYRPDQAVHDGVWVGGFRGFGGLFSAPPRVTRCGERLLVSDGMHSGKQGGKQSGERSFLLTADAFGATFHRASAEEIANAEAATSSHECAAQHGKLLFRGRTLDVTGRGELSSAVVSGPTCAATFSLSHQIVLLPSEVSA